MDFSGNLTALETLFSTVVTDGHASTSAAFEQILGSTTIDYAISTARDNYTVTNNNSAFRAIIAQETFTEGTAGTHAVIGSLAVRAPVITDGTAATTNAVTLYVDGAPTGTASPTNLYSVWIDAGVVRIDDTIELGAASDTTLSRSSAGQLAVEGVQCHFLSRERGR